MEVGRVEVGLPMELLGMPSAARLPELAEMHLRLVGKVRSLRRRDQLLTRRIDPIPKPGYWARAICEAISLSRAGTITHMGRAGTPGAG